MSALNYKHLRYFWAVAHEGNLTRAASHLNVSQSALSIQIQKLEQTLGEKLFDRRGKQLVLTEAGHIALDHADVIFQAGDELLGTLRDRRPSKRQVLRVGALATLSRNFQLQFLSPLLGRDDVRLVLHAGRFDDLIPSLEAHQLDVVLANMAPQRDVATSWVPHLIDTQPVSLIAHKGFDVDGRHPAHLLAHTPLILPSASSSIRTGFDSLVDRMDIRPSIAAEVDDMAMLRLLTRDGAGLAVVPPIVVQDELESGSLVEVARLPDLSETFYAITLSRRFPNPLLRLLIEEGHAVQADRDARLHSVE